MDLAYAVVFEKPTIYNFDPSALVNEGLDRSVDLRELQAMAALRYDHRAVVSDLDRD